MANMVKTGSPRSTALMWMPILCTWFVACGDPHKPPVVSTVSPSRANNDVDVPIELKTHYLSPELDIDVRSGKLGYHVTFSLALLAEGDPTARTVDLAPATWSASDVYIATAPKGLPVGIYSLRIVDRFGNSTTVLHAYESLGPDKTPPMIQLLKPSATSPLPEGTPADARLQIDDGYGQIASTKWKLSLGDLTTDVGTWTRSPEPPTPGAPEIWTCTFPVPPLPHGVSVLPFKIWIEVTDQGGNATTLEKDFEAASSPSVVGFSPSAGALAGGQPFWLVAHNLRPNSRVFLGDLEIVNQTQSPVSDEDTRISGLTPPNKRAESLPVNVASPGSFLTAPGAGFQYLALPVVRAIEPAVGPVGMPIRVTVTGNSLNMNVNLFVGTGPGDKVPVTMLLRYPPNKIVGCLPPRSVLLGGGSVNIWAEDDIAGSGLTIDAPKFTYVDDGLGVASVSSACPNVP